MIEKATKIIAALTAFFALLGGGYKTADTFGVFKQGKILEWHPEFFSISDGLRTGSFNVVVAREKFRDDCAVEQFDLEVRDSNYVVHKATPSVSKFSGPASKTVDKYGYSITIEHPESVSPGKAMLFARIQYKCPEGSVLVTYPNHENLTFNIKQEK